MSKKMKELALKSSPYGVFGDDSRAMLKHQTLMQDYQELYKDAEVSRYKLDTMKQRKETLLAEVRFLRRRYKYLLKNKSAELPQEHLQPHYALDHRKTDTKLQISYKKEATERVTKLKKKTSALPGKEILIQNMLPSFDPNYKGKKHVGNITGRPNPTTTLTLHAKRQLYKGKEVIHQNSTPLLNLNQERAYDGISATMHNTTPTFDLNHKETTYSVKQPSIQNRLPSFDLNQISREEEELQKNGEASRLEEPKKGLMNEEQLSDLRLSLCRNIGNGSNHGGKRKISWQDPVALRV